MANGKHTELITRAAIVAAKQSIPLMVTLRDAFATKEDSVTFEVITNYKEIIVLGGLIVIRTGEKKIVTIRGKPAFREYVCAQLNAPGASVKELMG